MKIRIYSSKTCFLHYVNLYWLETTSVKNKVLKIKISQIAEQLLSNF